MNYRIDHLAFRTLNRLKCVRFFQEALGYKTQAEFTVQIGDDPGDGAPSDWADCTTLEPSDRVASGMPWSGLLPWQDAQQKYVLAPEIFVSQGSPGGTVEAWCTARGGAGLHHIALQIPEGATVEAEMQKWLDRGWAEGFTSERPMQCEGLTQVFTRPSSLTGVIFELIERDVHGFCAENVAELMESTKGL